MAAGEQENQQLTSSMAESADRCVLTGEVLFPVRTQQLRVGDCCTNIGFIQAVVLLL